VTDPNWRKADGTESEGEDVEGYARHRG